MCVEGYSSLRHISHYALKVKNTPPHSGTDQELLPKRHDNDTMEGTIRAHSTHDFNSHVVDVSWITNWKTWDDKHVGTTISSVDKLPNPLQEKSVTKTTAGMVRQDVQQKIKSQTCTQYYCD